MISGLQLWEDNEARAPSEQMAVDEALLHRGCRPVVRFYRWAAPAVTFGYAQRYSDVRRIEVALPLIRRWTGGGMVYHGEDLTVALAVPASHAFCHLQIGVIYQRIHAALLSEVEKIFSGARLATHGDCRPGAACFQSPALNDILHDGRKICGGALRCGKNGVLYQGSLHGNFSVLPLGHSLCSSVELFEPDEEVLRLSASLAKERYGTERWNQMR